MRQLASLVVATALSACSLDSIRFTPESEPRAEDCATPGDEDGNGLADLRDPACAAAAPQCGNGETEPGEACDDGNAQDGDGCEATCKVTGTASYPASADAMIRTSTEPGDAGRAFGALPGLSTYASSFGTVERSLIAFDLSTLPPGTTIQSAQLNVRLIDQAGIEFSVEVHEVIAPWAEAEVTWASQPVFRDTIEASLGYQGYKWWRFELKDLVQRWVDAPGDNFGLLLRQTPEVLASGGELARFDSREGTYRPALDIIVAPRP